MTVQDMQKAQSNVEDEVIVSDAFIEHLIAEGAPESLVDAIRSENALRRGRSSSHAPA